MMGDTNYAAGLTASEVVKVTIAAYRDGDTKLVNHMLKHGAHDHTPLVLFEEIVMQTGGDV